MLFRSQAATSTVTALPISFHRPDGLATSSAGFVQSTEKPCNLSASLISGEPIVPSGNAIAGGDGIPIEDPIFNVGSHSDIIL